MDLGKRIRATAEIAEPEAIATSLNIPLEIVQGVISGEISDDFLADYDSKTQIKMVEKTVIVKGNLVQVVQHSPLAAAFAKYASQHNKTAVIDLEPYPTLPLYLGVSVSRIPTDINMLWDEEIDNKECQKNLFAYMPIPGNQGSMEPVLGAYPTVVINTHLCDWAKIAPMAGIIYVPVTQNEAGIHRLYQMLANNKVYQNKIQIVWIKGPGSISDTESLSIVRRFSDVQIAGHIAEMFMDCNSTAYEKHIPQILSSVFPYQKAKKSLFPMFR